MFRDDMAADHGMLFIHEREEPQAYWMKNTHIPLDILYFDDARKLVSQQRDVPPCSLGDALPAVSERRPGALRARTQCRPSRAPEPAGRRELQFGPGVHAAADARRLTCAARHGRSLPTCATGFALPDWNSLAALGRRRRCRCSIPRC